MDCVSVGDMPGRRPYGATFPVEGGVYAAHRREIEAADDPKGYLEKLQEEYRAVASPFRTAEAFGIEDIIDPVETRPLLCEWVEMAYQVESSPSRAEEAGDAVLDK